MKLGLPDRWLDYYPLGQQVSGTRFVAFKVPLKEVLLRRLPKPQWFTPAMVIAHLPSLRLVVDLTNTSRYYFPQDFIREGVEYKKIMCPGHQIPPKNLVRKFYAIVDQFIMRNPDPESLIGVHCTHGLNRTAFFICSYMIERLGMAPQAALAAFQNGRGYSVERENYIKELMSLKPLSAPPLDEQESLYPQEEQPSTNRKRPASRALSRHKNVRMLHTDEAFQRPVPSQLGNYSQQYGHSEINQHHLQGEVRNRPPGRQSHERNWRHVQGEVGNATAGRQQRETNQHHLQGEVWNATTGRQLQRCSYSGDVEQYQAFPSQLNDGGSSGRARNFKYFSSRQQGVMPNSFSDNGWRVRANSTDDSVGQQMTSVNRNVGNNVWEPKRDDSFVGRGRGYGRDGQCDRGYRRGRMMRSRDRHMPVNTTNIHPDDSASSHSTQRRTIKRNTKT